MADLCLVPQVYNANRFALAFLFLAFFHFLLSCFLGIYGGDEGGWIGAIFKGMWVDGYQLFFEGMG